jgi:glucokinase
MRQSSDRAPHSFDRLIAAARELRGRHEAQGRVFRAVGFGYDGQVNLSQQRVLRCPHEEGWEDLDVRDVLQREFALPCVIENDCKLAALAEAHLGAGRGHRTVFYVTIGTGIGGGIVRDGQIVDFGESGEAEIGHIIVDAGGGLLCPCGSWAR